jgi:hypothetical protein
LKFKPGSFCNFGKRHGFAVQDHEARAGACEGCPAAILRAIVSFSIDPLQGEPWRAGTHVAEEAFNSAFAILA